MHTVAGSTSARASLAGPQLGRSGRHERSAEPRSRGRLPLLQATRPSGDAITRSEASAAPLLPEAAKQQVAAHGPSERRVHYS